MILLLCMLGLSLAMDTVVLHVEENTTPGTIIGNLRQDGASLFSLTEPLPAFTVDQTMGYVKVNNALDREERESYEFTVILMFSSDTKVRSPRAVTVIVTVTDVNDNAPRFLRHSVDLTIIESQPVGFKVQLDPAVDPDKGTNSTQSYRIVTEDMPFMLKQRMGFDDQFSCYLELIAPLDRETKSYYSIEIAAADGGTPANTDTLIVNIKVADVNDNSPQFNQSLYTPSIPESSPIGTNIVTVLATDLDEGVNSAITYFLEPRFNKDKLFSIDSVTGVIKVAGVLDREHAAKHELVVVATDGGEFAGSQEVRVTVTVEDVNDNTPSITVTYLSQSDHVAMVSENSKEGEFVAHVTVKDLDSGDNGEISLTLHSEEAPFSIATVGSGYALQVAGLLDRETQDTWYVWLEAKDHGNPSLASYHNVTVKIVDTNDCKPVFEQELYICNVSEIAEEGTDIARVTASDEDLGSSAVLTYSIVGMEMLGQENTVSDAVSFMINGRTGIISTASLLDREARAAVRLTIEARDSGVPSLASTTVVMVNIIDYNDNDPKFSQRHYTTVLDEDVAVGTKVLTVLAKDVDAGGTGVLTYAIKEYFSASRPVFSVNETTGDITTLISLDYEAQRSFNLVVEATDVGGRRGVTSVEVLIRDLNDNAPVFSQPAYKSSLLHTVLPGTLVTHITAIDLDSGANGKVTYSLIHGEEMFSIDSVTGVLSTRVVLREYSNKTVKLTVSATDSGTPSLSALTSVSVLIGSLSTIDLKPTFTSQVYSVEIPETAGVGEVVLSVDALSSDKDYTGTVQYSISSLSSDVMKRFNIDNTTGRVTLRDMLDREVKEKYHFIVEATDELGRQGLASVDLRVLDVNDNAPQFPVFNYHLSVKEGLKVGEVVTRFTATDPDQGINGIVRYALISASQDTFILDQMTGTLSLAKALDYEKVQSYHFGVRGYNKATSMLSKDTTVFITVIDENDNAPRFIKERFSFDILDSSLQGATVGVAMANDADSGDNGEVYYTLQPTMFSGMFSIDLTTGEIRTADNFVNMVLEEEYYLKVLARDRGSNSMNSTADVIVKVRTTGHVVETLQSVLKNEALSKRAQYLIIFFAAAFLMVMITLLVFVKYHKMDKAKYVAKASQARQFDYSRCEPMSCPPLKSDDLMSITPDLKMSKDSLDSTSHPRYPRGGYIIHDGNHGNHQSIVPLLNKYVQQPCCAAIPELKMTDDIISESYFTDSMEKCARRKKLSNESSASYNKNFVRTPSRSDVASSYELSPKNSKARSGDSHCSAESNDNNNGSTPPNSLTAFEEDENIVKRDLVESSRTHEKVRSWISGETSEDSLFKLKNLTGLPRMAKPSASRQVRFQQLHDSFV